VEFNRLSFTLAVNERKEAIAAQSGLKETYAMLDLGKKFADTKQIPDQERNHFYDYLANRVMQDQSKGRDFATLPLKQKLNYVALMQKASTTHKAKINDISYSLNEKLSPVKCKDIER
jgi:hypothetical protein